MNEPTFDIVNTLAQNGPWALMAGFLLFQVLKSWNSDREQVTKLLSEFKGAIDSLAHAVDTLSDRLDGIEKKG